MGVIKGDNEQFCTRLSQKFLVFLAIARHDVGQSTIMWSLSCFYRSCVSTHEIQSGPGAVVVPAGWGGCRVGQRVVLAPMPPYAQQYRAPTVDPGGFRPSHPPRMPSNPPIRHPFHQCLDHKANPCPQWVVNHPFR